MSAHVLLNLLKELYARLGLHAILFLINTIMH